MTITICCYIIVLIACVFAPFYQFMSDVTVLGLLMETMHYGFIETQAEMMALVSIVGLALGFIGLLTKRRILAGIVGVLCGLIMICYIAFYAFTQIYSFYDVMGYGYYVITLAFLIGGISALKAMGCYVK